MFWDRVSSTITSSSHEKQEIRTEFEIRHKPHRNCFDNEYALSNHSTNFVLQNWTGVLRSLNKTAISSKTNLRTGSDSTFFRGFRIGWSVVLEAPSEQNLRRESTFSPRQRLDDWVGQYTPLSQRRVTLKLYVFFDCLDKGKLSYTLLILLLLLYNDFFLH